MTTKLANVEEPNTELTAYERKFVELVALGETYSAAARKAGFASSRHNYHVIMRRADIREAIHKQQIINQRALDIRREDVLNGFLEAKEMAKLKEDPTAMIAAWREIGKVCGMYESQVKLEITHRTESEIEKLIDQLDEEDLIALIERDMKTIEGEIVEEN